MEWSDTPVVNSTVCKQHTLTRLLVPCLKTALILRREFTLKTTQPKKGWNHNLVSAEEGKNTYQLLLLCQELYKCWFINHNNPRERVSIPFYR